MFRTRPRVSPPLERRRSLLSSHQRGFTIVEVMMAAAVMALAIATSIAAMQRGFLSLDTARKLTTAGQIMQCEMEKMRMVKWSEINAYPTTLDPMPLDSIFTSDPAVASNFTLRRDIAVVPTTTGVGMKQITFTVSWKSYDGRVQSRNYTSYYGENGLYDYYYNQL
jgi:prepilin-type N-terminal cleavage/methylation domain-containing protein